jgi:hypothetical protein
VAKNKLKLVNESRQRRDIILLKKKGSEPCSLLAGASVDITEAQISPQLKTMLKNPKGFGLRLVTPPTKESRAKTSDDEEDE